MGACEVERLVGGGLSAGELERVCRVDALLRSIPGPPSAIPQSVTFAVRKLVRAPRAAEARLRVGRPSDEAVLAGFAAGERDAAAELVRRFQARVYGLALTIVRDRALAEDVAQEAFLRAWRRAETYDARRASVLTWLLAITRNLAIDLVRPRSSEPLQPEVIAAHLELDARRVDDVGEAALLDVREAVRGALVSLPPEQRRALVLAVYFGRTAGEIAEQDGVALGTVKWRIRQAMNRLREEVERP